MPFYKASVADVLRCSQRDVLAVQQLEDHIQNVFRLSSNNASSTYPVLKKNINVLANVWYYFLTSANNLQTLGEEYTGLIRVSKNGKIPARFVQILWLLLYTGGDAFSEYLLNQFKKTIRDSQTLDCNAKLILERIVDFCKTHKDIFRKLHYSLFYAEGKYYYMSNRATGMKYVLLRQWMQNDSFSGWFKILGNISLFYIIYDFIQTLWQQKTQNANIQTVETSFVSNKICSLCCENRRSTSCTPCGHVYCWDCIYDSMGYQKWCPLCREPLNPSRIVLLQNYV